MGLVLSLGRVSNNDCHHLDIQMDSFEALYDAGYGSLMCLFHAYKLGHEVESY